MLVDGSDSEDASSQVCSFDSLQPEAPCTSAIVREQTEVNQQIFAQFSAIGTRVERTRAR